MYIVSFIIFRQFQYEDYEFDDEQSFPKVNTDEYEGRGFTSRSFNDPITTRLNKFAKLSEYTRSHFRPTDQTATSTTSSTTTVSSTSTSATISSIGVSSSTTPVPSTFVTNTEEVNTQSPVTSTILNITAEVNDDDQETNNTTILPSVTVVQIVREQNFSINEIPGQHDRLDEDLEESAELQLTHLSDTTIGEDATSQLPETTSIPMELLTDQEEILGADTKTTLHETIVSNEQQQFRPRPEYRPSSISETSNTGGQLYQDAAAKDQQEQPVLKLRGV